MYSYAYNLSMALNLVTTSINRAWGPIYYDLAGTEEGRRQLPRLTTVYASAVAIAAIGFTMYMPDLLVLLASRKEYWAGAGIMPIIVAGYFFFAMYMVVSTPVFYAAKTRWLPPLSAAALVINVGINLWAIPAFGMYGAAWATFAAYVVMAAGARYLAGRVDGQFEDGRLVAVIAIYALGFAATYAVASLDVSIFVGMALKAVLFALLLLLFVAFRVVTVAELRSLLESPPQGEGRGDRRAGRRTRGAGDARRSPRRRTRRASTPTGCVRSRIGSQACRDRARRPSAAVLSVQWRDRRRKAFMTARPVPAVPAAVRPRAAAATRRPTSSMRCARGGCRRPARTSQRFEGLVRETVGAAHAVATVTGTEALHLGAAGGRGPAGRSRHRARHSPSSPPRTP